MGNLESTEASIEIPPPYWSGGLGNFEEAGGQSYIWGLKKEDGTTCMDEFPTKQGLQAHRLRAVEYLVEHGKMTVGAMVPTNQCPFRRSIFKTSLVARVHVRNSYRCQRCVPRMAEAAGQLLSKRVMSTAWQPSNTKRVVVVARGNAAQAAIETGGFGNVNKQLHARLHIKLWGSSFGCATTALAQSVGQHSVELMVNALHVWERVGPSRQAIRLT